MKSNLLKALSFFMMTLGVLGVSSCDEKPGPVGPDTPTDPVDSTATALNVKVAELTETTASLSIDVQNLNEVAYLLSEEPAEISKPAVIFATGTTMAAADTTVTFTDLEANKKYWAYFTAITLDGEYHDIVSVEFTTSNYEFAKMLTLVDTEYQGYKVRITVPDEVRNNPEKYGIRYNFGSVLDVLMAKYDMGRTWATSLMENGHGCMGWQETQKDTTVYINPWNQNRQNPDGSYYVDPELGEEIMLHYPLAPGEPYLFVAGQYRYGHLDETGWGWSYGDESKDWGYYIPLWNEAGWRAEYGDSPNKSNLQFDPATGTLITGEEKYWDNNSFGENGTFQALYFMTKQPDLLETDFEVVIDNITPIDAKVQFIPDDIVFCYSYFICNDATYNEIVNNLLLGNEDWLQWFTCSFYAMQNLSVPTAEGPLELQASTAQGAYLASENLYHILVTVTGDQEGSKQKFIHTTFETTEKVLDPPVINVTAVESGQNEYYATFNVKAPNKDVKRAYYGADYKREFLVEANTGTQYESLAQNAFSEDDIKKINSEEGLNVQIPSTDGQTVRMVVLGFNAEETKNELYSPEKTGRPCPAVADCNTKLLALVPRIDSPLFDLLEGEWTATAYMMVREYDSNNVLQEYRQKFSTNISIMNTFEAPALTDEAYAVYAQFGYSKEATDALYEELKKEINTFNDYRLTYRNRLLCLGWFDYDFYSPSRLATKNPYDLFTWDEYSCIDNAQILYDFGPKWYLEIDKDGNVTLPFDQWKTPPMTNWQGTPFFMAAYNQETNHGYKSEVISQTNEGEVLMPASFPVEIVNDDKFIIRGVNAPVEDVADAKTYPHYPNAIGGWGEGDAVIIRPVISEITLTRGWSDKTETSASRSRRNYVEVVDLSGEDLMPVVVKSMTNVSDVVVPQFKKADMHIVTIEMLKEAAARRVEELNRNR